MAEVAEVRSGIEIGGYRLEELVGRGGMGDVYRAWDPRLQRNVALKILSPRYADDVTFRERLLRESRLAASLDHPNVVPVYDAGEAEGRFYLAMRYVEGTDLRALLRRRGALDPERSLAIVSQVADALDVAHSRGLVHRDVKPSNVLLDARGHCYLADFGLTESVSGRAQPTDGSLLGTLDYVAPEQIRGDHVDGRADVYSLGCLLYECLTGEVPFRRPSELATVFAHLEEVVPHASERRPELPPDVDAVLARAMAKDPAVRQSSCSALVEEARTALGIEQGGRTRSPWWAVLGAILVLALLVAIALGVSAVRGEPASPAPPGTLVRVDARTNEVVGHTEVSGRPGNVVVSGGHVWMADFFEGVLWRYSPASEAVQRITSTGEPRDLAALGRDIYVAADGEFLSGIVSRFDAATGVRKDGLDLLACAIVAGDGVVWTAGCPFVQRLNTDRKPLRKIEEVFLPYLSPSTAENSRVQFRELAVGAGSLWVLGDALDQRMWRLDARTGEMLAVVELGFPPRSAAVGGGAVWVTDSLGDVVRRVDVATNRLLAPVVVGRSPGGVAVGDGSAWVPNALDGTVSRIDLRTGVTVATIDVGGFPREIAYADGTVWVTGHEG